MTLPKYQLTIGPMYATVVVNGQELPAPSGITLQHGPNQIPVLALEYPAEVELEGEGIIQVVREPDEATVFAAMVEWLEEIDPDGLREEVSATLRTLRDDPVKNTLAYLIRVAQENANG